MDVLETVRQDRAVAVIRAERVADPAGLAGALAGAGVRAVEFTFTIPGVTEAIRAAAASGALIGAGTVLTARQAEEAVEAGARFLVSPAVRPAVAEAGQRHGVPVFLGALTPTEILAALDAGAAAVKLFPSSVGGPRYVKDLRGPFPDLAVIPSGGVTEANAREYLAAGAIAVYAGASLAPPELVAAGDHAEIQRRAKRFVAALG